MSYWASIERAVAAWSGLPSEQAVTGQSVTLPVSRAKPGVRWWTVLAWDGAKASRGPWRDPLQAEAARERACRADKTGRTRERTMIACYRTREQARFGEVTDPFTEESGRLPVPAIEPGYRRHRKKV